MQDTKLLNKPLTVTLLTLLFIIIAYFPIFLHLENLPIRVWDEARLATNAYEMLNNKNFIVTHFYDQPDMWNTKPPLMIWLQVLSLKIFGLGELAIRLPSALAALFTCLFLIFFSSKYLKTFWLGFIAGLVLITSGGYISMHASRTGDYDALLTLFLTVSALTYFIFLGNPRQSKKLLYITVGSLTLAVLTKGIAGILFAPALVLYTVLRKRLFTVLSMRAFYISLLVFLIVAGGYYLLRERFNPGYLAAVYQNELGGRYLKPIEGHSQDFWFYFENLVNYRFSFWYILIPLGLVIGLALKNMLLRRLTGYVALLIVCYFFIISSGQTKLEWYDVPLFPLLSLLTALFVYWLFHLARDAEWLYRHLNLKVVPYIILFMLFLNPYSVIIDKVYKPRNKDWERGFYDTSTYLKKLIEGKKKSEQPVYVIYKGYAPHVRFYMEILKTKGIQVDFKDWTTLREPDRVITNQQNLKQYVEQHYCFEVLDQLGAAKLYQIKGDTF